MPDLTGFRKLLAAAADADLRMFTGADLRMFTGAESPISPCDSLTAAHPVSIDRSRPSGTEAMPIAASAIP